MTASVPPISDPSAGATPSATRIARASALIPHGWALRTCAADKRLRAAFPDFHPEIHWQAAAGNLVTTYKTYHGTHQGEFLGVPATGKKVRFYTVDAMRVVDGKITEHWGVATLLDLMQQLGVVPPLGCPGSKRC